jgi:hypothetical protein
MNAVNAATTEAKANTDTTTTTTTTTIKAKQSHGIDFIDASKEWRKNKIKYDNVTFEYIWM